MVDFNTKCQYFNHQLLNYWRCGLGPTEICQLFYRQTFKSLDYYASIQYIVYCIARNFGVVKIWCISSRRILAAEKLAKGSQNYLAVHTHIAYWVIKILAQSACNSPNLPKISVIQNF